MFLAKLVGTMHTKSEVQTPATKKKTVYDISLFII